MWASSSDEEEDEEEYNMEGGFALTSKQRRKPSLRSATPDNVQKNTK